MAVINRSKNEMKTNRGTIATATTIATTIAAEVYPHELGRDLIPELAMRVYSSQLDSFREAISNAFDENSQKVVLSASNHKITIEDWGNGIKDYDEFRKFGQASKKSRKEKEVIGEKGLGKLSLLNLGRTVCFETNNGKMGIKFYMTLSGFTSPIYKKDSAAFISHRGTKITITKLATTPDIGELTAYLKKVFSLRLAQGTTIVLNDQAIKPRPNVEPAEQFLFELTKVKDSDANVTGNLKATEDGKGIVDLYIDHVFVTSLQADTRRKFDGWVNCNALTPETSRNNIVQNGIYREFIFLLRRYIHQGFS
jgi:Histidine kinase-, DNA gyrase B-, and HSP90-like ATPase